MHIRYRRTSPKTVLGITQLKKRINNALGITAIKRPVRAPENFKRRMLRRVGYYSEPMKFLRNMPSVFRRRRASH